MALTPHEIVNYPLKQSVRGYSVAQVDQLLDQLADEIERLQKEVESNRERLATAEHRLSEASDTETTLKRTLVTAQRAAEQTIEEARARSAELLDSSRHEAAATVEQARLEGEQLKVDALQAARAEEAAVRRRRQELEARVEALRIFERDYRIGLRAFVDGQLRALDETQIRPPAADPGNEPMPEEQRTEPPPFELRVSGASFDVHAGTE